MRSRRTALPALLAGLGLLGATPGVRAGDWQDHAPHPFPVANNAVATHVKAGTTFVYTFMGIDSTKVWSGIGLSAARVNTFTDQWQTLPDVPITNGRVAASAVTVGDSVYVIGGYRVAQNGQETTARGMQVFDTVTDQWVVPAPPLLPRRVDDMVTAVWADSLIYCISGWSTSTNITDVQFFDPVSWTWGNATPIPGFGTFGGVGGICGNTIVYADGVADTALFSFDPVNRVLVGTIDPLDATLITWEDRGPHPGASVYRGASGNIPGDPTRVLIVGGTDNPYNYDGLGYDGNPSEPLGQTWSYHVPTGTAVFHAPKDVPTMDHRGLPAGADGRLWVVGGMESGQTVTARVSSWIPDGVTAAPVSAGLLPPVILAFPSPARTSVRFLSSGGQRMDSVRLIDIRGRTVRRMPEGSGKDGSVFWDLKDRKGARVAPGHYWMVARLGEAQVAQSVVVQAP